MNVSQKTDTGRRSCGSRAAGRIRGGNDASQQIRRPVYPEDLPLHGRRRRRARSNGGRAGQPGGCQPFRRRRPPAGSSSWASTGCSLTGGVRDIIGRMPARPLLLMESKILRAYAEKTPGSRALHNRAKALLPDGVTHVGRFLEPHPIYVERAAGSRKWDVDGNEYVDYLGGHGALILGHGCPAVVKAATAQAGKGVHYGACHALEVQWAELVQQMIPSAQRVRFTVTGTEATHLALRVSRAFTGKSKIIRFAGHFHGWHDHVCFPPSGAPGVIAGIVKETLVAAPNDLQQVEQ
jgi:hypothetical protein